jgi:hypothetical protein
MVCISYLKTEAKKQKLIKVRRINSKIRVRQEIRNKTLGPLMKRQDLFSIRIGGLNIDIVNHTIIFIFFFFSHARQEWYVPFIADFPSISWSTTRAEEVTEEELHIVHCVFRDWLSRSKVYLYACGHEDIHRRAGVAPPNLNLGNKCRRCRRKT